MTKLKYRTIGFLFILLLILSTPLVSAFNVNEFSLKKYAYARNNPVKYTDPSGNFICGGICTIGAIIGLGTFGGGIIAGGIDLISQIWQGSSISEGTVDWNQVGGSTTIGATAGGTFAAAFGLGSLALGGTAAGVGLSTTTEIGLGVASGVVAGRTAQLTYNELNDRPLTENLFEPKSVATDAILSGTLSGIARGIRAVRMQINPQFKPDFYGTPNKQLVPSHTPVGREITPHAANRMANPPLGRVPMTPAEADNIISRGSIRKIDDLAKTTTYWDPTLPGKPQVAISNTYNGRITTVIKKRVR